MILPWMLRSIFFAPENDTGADNADDLDADDATFDDADDIADDADDGDEADDADEGAAPDNADVPEKPAPTRGETRAQKLANELRKEREARIAAEARAEERLRSSTVAQPRDTGEAARKRQEMLDLMDPTEKRIFLQDESIKRMENEILRTKFEGWDSKDESKYDSIATKDTPQGRYYAKNKDRVEQALAEARRAGHNPNREAIAKLLFADDAFKAKPSKSLSKDKAAAAARVNAAKGAPASARGDAGGKKSGDDSLEALKARILERERIGAT